MTCRKNASVNDGYQKITCLLTAASQFSDQRHSNDVDNSDSDHSRNRTGRVDLRPLINVLCHCAAKRSVWNVYTGISQHQQAVCDHHIDDLGCIRPVRMCPECHNQKHGRDRSCNEKPWTITPPFRFGFICQSTHDRIIDRIPKSRKQHQGRDCRHTDPEYICVKYHQKITDKHPAEITAYITKTIRDLTDQRYLSVSVFTTHNSSCFSLLLVYCLSLISLPDSHIREISC